MLFFLMFFNNEGLKNLPVELLCIPWMNNMKDINVHNCTRGGSEDVSFISKS